METIYELIEETNKKNKKGEKLNLYKCKICGIKILKIKKNTVNIKTCKHKQIFHNSQGLSKTRLYRIYISMQQRCNNKNRKDWKIYGGRNIKVCKEWEENFIKFYEWSIRNGYQDNLTIDRINSNKDYEPNNCRWIEKSENSRFKRGTKAITVKNQTKSCNQWAKELKKGKNFISRMLKQKGLEFTINYIEKYI